MKGRVTGSLPASKAQRVQGWWRGGVVRAESGKVERQVKLSPDLPLFRALRYPTILLVATHTIWPNRACWHSAFLLLLRAAATLRPSRHTRATRRTNIPRITASYIHSLRTHWEEPARRRRRFWPPIHATNRPFAHSIPLHSYKPPNTIWPDDRRRTTHHLRHAANARIPPLPQTALP